jgi:hypothetical protein
LALIQYTYTSSVLGSARFEALLHPSTVPIFGIDVLCTCPCALAWLGLGSDEFVGGIRIEI